MQYGKKLFGLVLLGVAGYLLFSVAALAVGLLVWGNRLSESTAALLTIQFISSIGAFLVPALWLDRRSEGDFLRTRCGFSRRALGWALLAYALLCPVVEGLMLWSEGWHLDESSWAVLRWFDAQSKNAQQLIEKLLHTDNPWLFLCSLVVVGPVAGVCEEFFFRGGIQNLLFSWFCGNTGAADTDSSMIGGTERSGGNRFRNKRMHAAVWLTAFVFSSVHLDLAGFLPRLLLGALLGYIYVWGGSIWLPVTIHTLNNILTAVLEHLK